ncbi:MAG: YtxH domain-containing protein [Patescibacteria group bacterium]
MTKQNEIKLSNFWIGFAAGISGAAGLAFLFGTKKGRENLKKLLKLSENLDEQLERFIDKIDKEHIKKQGKADTDQVVGVADVISRIKQITNRS